MRQGVATCNDGSGPLAEKCQRQPVCRRSARAMILAIVSPGKNTRRKGTWTRLYCRDLERQVRPWEVHR